MPVLTSPVRRRPLLTRRLALVVVAACLLVRMAGAQMMPAEGASAAWHTLGKLRTTATVMHTTAHPDDEHGGVLAWLSRGQGARVSLATLTRGESGGNALGPEMFDGLGLIRTDELLIAGSYYGVDEQYFGTVVDYGFSKRLDETIEKWGRAHVLRDMVGIIRTERPLVLISRFQGNERDGHGNHSAAGLVTQDAFRLAADPTAFPEQIAGGLRPWQPLKLYMGGVRANEDWTIKVDAGEYDAVLGDSYQSLARRGLGFQRSQNGGRVMSPPGPSVSYYKRLQSMVDAPEKERSFFEGIDTTIPGLYRALRQPAPAGAEGLLIAIDRELQAAVGAFTFADPSAAAPALARALAATRAAVRRLAANSDGLHLLRIKEHQIAEALHAVLGVTFTAIAQPSGTPESAGPFGGGPPDMAPVVPGQTFDVRATFASRGKLELDGVTGYSVISRDGWSTMADRSVVRLPRNQPHIRNITIVVPENASLTRPYFSRRTMAETRYAAAQGAPRYRPWGLPAFEAGLTYVVAGVPVSIRRPVTRIEANLPYGLDIRELAVLPAIAVNLSPTHAVARLGAASNTVRVKAEVLNNRDGMSAGAVRLDVPDGWTVQPGSHEFQLSRAGERALVTFDISIPSLESRDYPIQAVATAGKREYREGYRTIRYRDLETRYLYREASASVRGIDVRLGPGLKVGYVMGMGDDVPAGLAQLGVDVQLLGEPELATADLGRFDTIMTGTRAYAVRQDLKTHNRRLLDYVSDGGNLIVLYNTQELAPNLYAPYPAELTATAEEVSEESSPVEILNPDAPVLSTPNRITKADFEHWVEQRGSKFWTTWDPRYTPMIATWDLGQAPQHGGWLHARYGKGHYTYFAYALHRQLPYAVPGAYRLLANLLSLNQTARVAPPPILEKAPAR